MLRAVGVCAFIQEDRIIFQGCKSVRKTGRYPQHFFVFTTEFNAKVRSISWRAFPDVHNYIQYTAFLNTYQFPLRFWRRLKMQAAYYTFTGKALVVLHEVGRNTGTFKIILAVGLKEIASMVTKDTRFDYK